jgi:hypothetical protein
MWKRDDAAKPSTPASAAPTPAPAQHGNAPQTAESTSRPASAGDPQRGQERNVVNIGKSVVIKGELNGSEDLTIEGQVEGKIELRQNVLTIGANARIKAQVFAKAVIIPGEVTGQRQRLRRSTFATTGRWTATSRRASRLRKAHFRGSIDMQ